MIGAPARPASVPMRCRAALAVLFLCGSVGVMAACHGRLEPDVSSKTDGGDSPDGGEPCVLQGDKCVGDDRCVTLVAGYRIDLDRHCVDRSTLLALACESFGDDRPVSALQIECGQRTAKDGGDRDSGVEFFELPDPAVDPYDAGVGLEPCPAWLADDTTWHQDCP